MPLSIESQVENKRDLRIQPGINFIIYKMKTKVKWYNDPQMVGTLLLFWPPVGIYGLYKSETIDPKWKKLTYVTLALVCILFAMIYLN